MALDILSLDLARVMGWARGRAGMKPDSGSVALGAPGSGGLILGGLATWLVAHRKAHGVPDLVCVEHWLNIRASRNDRQVEQALRLNGVVHGIMGGIYHVWIVEPYPDTVRAAVCGRKNADNRDATKAMVCENMTLRGLLEPGSTDDNRADALCAWVYCEAVYGRRAPQDFTLT